MGQTHLIEGGRKIFERKINYVTWRKKEKKIGEKCIISVKVVTKKIIDPEETLHVLFCDLRILLQLSQFITLTFICRLLYNCIFSTG